MERSILHGGERLRGYDNHDMTVNDGKIQTFHITIRLTSVR